MKYTARSAFAGRVWLWAHQLNKLDQGETLEITFNGKTLSVKREDIKNVSSMQKETYNPLRRVNERQYGFDVKAFT